MGLVDWYRSRSQWHEIRALGFSSIVKVSILAPVVGYLILSNPVSFAFFESWKFYCFYAGVTSISIGAILYSWFCPGEAKKYGTGVEYALAEVDFFVAKPKIIEHSLRYNIARLQLSRPDIYFDLLAIGACFSIAAFDEERSRRRDATLFLLDELWHAKNFRQRNVRVLCRILYDVGLVLLFTPSAYTTLQVLGLFPRP